MALGYQNPFYLKQAQKKQQSLYDGKVLLTKHDLIVLHDSQQITQRLIIFRGVFVPQTALSLEELYFSNISKTANVSKSISIPIEDLSDDTTPSVARKFIYEEADASLAKHKILELEIERLLKAVVSQDIISVVQNAYVVDTSDLQTYLERTKERFENCIIKKETEYAKLWNDWYKKCNECKYDKISYNKAYKDMQQKIKRLQAQLRDLKGKSTDTACVSDTQKQLFQKLENANVELEFQVIQIYLWCVDSGCSKHMTGNLKLLINFVWKFIGTVRFENDHVAAILVGQFYDSDLEVAFRRNACFVRNLEGVDLLKGDRSAKLNTINLHEMASASPICLMARASSTKSWLWHQRLSHLNFDTINDLARNDLVSGLPKFKYHKEHLCPSCEQGKSKRAS
nr:retrovirus-related Pol polyprotein from transposon TNT 1-94 [Tanacetum cinerariifolium]